MLRCRATAMQTLKDITSTAKVSSGGVEKVRRARKCGSARTAPPSPALSHHAWLDIASEVSSASSDQNEGSFSGRSLTRASSNQDLSLACPYAKLNSIVTMQSFGDNGNVGRPQCWNKSYPNIPRLKYAEIPPGASLGLREC
jgi:hypothetical protein